MPSLDKAVAVPLCQFNIYSQIKEESISRILPFLLILCMVRFRLFLGCLLSTLACVAQSNNNSTGLNTTSSGKKSYPPGNAWTLSWPLGEHKTAAIDTLLYGYQREFVPAIKSDACASTGAFAAEGLDMVYFSRPRLQYHRRGEV